MKMNNAKPDVQGIMLLIVTVLFVTILQGCIGRPSLTESQAEVFLARYFETIRTQKFEKALDFYSPLFYKQIPREDWLKTLRDLHQKLGDFKSYKLEYWQRSSNIGIGSVPSGTYIKFIYTTHYSKFSAKEIFVVFKPRYSQTMKFITHIIRSEGLLKQANA